MHELMHEWCISYWCTTSQVWRHCPYRNQCVVWLRLAEIEYKLRIAQTHHWNIFNATSRVKMWSYLQNFKNWFSHGQSANTRAQNTLDGVSCRSKWHGCSSSLKSSGNSLQITLYVLHFHHTANIFGLSHKTKIINHCRGLHTRGSDPVLWRWSTPISYPIILPSPTVPISATAHRIWTRCVVAIISRKAGGSPFGLMHHTFDLGWPVSALFIDAPHICYKSWSCTTNWG